MKMAGSLASLFNTKLKEYKVDYADETSDYLLSDDFDGVKVILEYGHRQ